MLCNLTDPNLTFTLGLAAESRRMLEEFSKMMPAEPIDTADSQPIQEDKQSWTALEQEGIAQGFIDDVHGLLGGK